MKFKEYLELFIEHDSKKNKKEMLKKLKGIYISAPRYKSILVITSRLMRKLQARGRVKQIAVKRPVGNGDEDRLVNVYYEVVGTDIVLLRVRDCFYKIIQAGDVIDYLSMNYYFQYYSSGRVCTYIKDMKYIGFIKNEKKEKIPVEKIGKLVDIEQIILDFMEYGKLNVDEVTMDEIHHKWLRLCALTDTIKFIDSWGKNSCCILT